MAIFSLDGLFTDATVESIKGTLYGYLTAARLPVRAWQALSPTRVAVDAIARIQQATQVLIVNIAKSAYLETGKGEWLKEHAREVFEVEPIEETFAVGEFVADNAGGGSYDFDPGEITILKTGSTLTYHNTEPVHIGSLETGVAFAIEADEAGAASNAAPGQLELSTSILGVTGTNQLPVTGLDAEEPEALRERCRLSRGPLSPNGPKDAYEYVARTPSLNGGVAVNRVRRLPHTGDGLITVVVAGVSGPLSPTEIGLIQTGIDTWATPATVLATVVSAGEVAQSVAARVYVPLYGGPNLDDLAAAIKNALISYINSIPIGGIPLVPGSGVVPWSGLVHAIKQTSLGEVRPILAVDLIGAGEVDVPLAPTEIATLAAASITLEFVTVST